MTNPFLRLHLWAGQLWRKQPVLSLSLPLSLTAQPPYFHCLQYNILSKAKGPWMGADAAHKKMA